MALAGASPERAAAPLQQLAGAQPWQMRMYAARAAAILKDRALLERLAKDESDNVCEAAIGGLKTVAGHEADDGLRGRADAHRLSGRAGGGRGARRDAASRTRPSPALESRAQRA